MAARGAYRSFSSAARNAFHSARSSSYSARSTHNAQFPPPPRRSGCTNTMPTTTRRRMAETMVPLHNAVAQAKLISHLAVSSRSRTSLSLGVFGCLDRFDLCCKLEGIEKVCKDFIAHNGAL